jgi:hypothetical protein
MAVTMKNVVCWDKKNPRKMESSGMLRRVALVRI